MNTQMPTSTPTPKLGFLAALRQRLYIRRNAQLFPTARPRPHALAKKNTRSNKTYKTMKMG